METALFRYDGIAQRIAGILATAGTQPSINSRLETELAPMRFWPDTIELCKGMETLPPRAAR